MISNYIKKFIISCFGYPLYLISFLVPRNKHKIVIGSHISFNDNSKYIYILSKQYLPYHKIIWISKQKNVVKKVKELGGDAHYTMSMQGLYHTLTAKFYIYNFHLPDINFWTSGGSIKFNLWHGIPLKNIAFATKNGPSSKIYNEESFISRLIRPHIYIRPDYMVTTSAEMSRYFANAFRIEESQCLEYGLARCDIFFYSRDKLMNHINTYESQKMLEFVKMLEVFKEIFIYMPTWREEVDFLYDAKFNFETLNQHLKQENKLFILKLHPFSKLKKINLNTINQYSNISVMDSEMDIYPILPFTDCLITDYSSIYYDYLLLENKAIYLYPFDYDSYVSKNRDLAFEYEEKMPGEKIISFDFLIEVIKRKKHKRTKKQEKIKIEYFENKKSLDSVKCLSSFIKELSL